MRLCVAGSTGASPLLLCLSGSDSMDCSDFDVWDFRRDGGGRWTWATHSADREPMAGSRRSFDTMDECVEDATRHGYSGALMLPAAR